MIDTTSYLVTAPCDFERQAATTWKTDTLEKIPPEVTMVEVELAHTRAFDSNGLSALMALNVLLKKRGGHLRLVDPSSTVSQLLELTSMHRLFVIVKEPLSKQPSAQRPILIVEDDAIIRNVAEMSLKALGRRIIFASNGQEAILMARRDQPAVILLDYVMPLMDGAETLRRLKASQETAPIPVLIMSANDRIASGVHQQFQGAAGFVVKPFSPNVLRHEVYRLLAEPAEGAAV